jgi:hypothetical protein
VAASGGVGLTHYLPGQSQAEPDQKLKWDFRHTDRGISNGWHDQLISTE